MKQYRLRRDDGTFREGVVWTDDPDLVDFLQVATGLSLVEDLSARREAVALVMVNGADVTTIHGYMKAREIFASIAQWVFGMMRDQTLVPEGGTATFARVFDQTGTEVLIAALQYNAEGDAVGDIVYDFLAITDEDSETTVRVVKFLRDAYEAARGAQG
jgi:hypothetical protein